LDRLNPINAQVKLSSDTYTSDHGMAIVSDNEVLQFAGRRLGDMVASNEMWCQVMPGRIAAGMAIRMAIGL
jgi:hypothetical protein